MFQGVAGGDLHAFQDVWMPNHKDLLAEVEDDVQHLDPWFQGQTAFGLAGPPLHEDIRSIADLNEAGTDTILGIEPGAPFMDVVENDVIPAYNLNLELKASSTAGMLAEVDRLYSNEEPFVFMPWVPHPMNEEYEYHFLEDPKNAQGAFDEPAKIATVLNADLKSDDPTAWAFHERVHAHRGAAQLAHGTRSRRPTTTRSRAPRPGSSRTERGGPLGPGRQAGLVVSKPGL
jgi:glycine betaine/proline transport system substrate-binding protein